MVSLTAGQQQAWRELHAISRATSGGVTVGPNEHIVSDHLVLTLVVDCTGTPHIPGKGIELGQRQTFTVAVPPDFPFSHPVVHSAREEFAGQPHVMWLNTICLYASPNDWEPARGMWDVVHRLLTWLARISQGTLVGPELALHPPTVAEYSSLDPVVVRPDLPPTYERDQRLWTCWAMVTPTGFGHHELTKWLTEPTSHDPKRRGATSFLAPVVGLPRPMDFLYPTQIDDLLRILAAQGLAREDCVRLLEQAMKINRRTDPVVLLIGSPPPAATTIHARVVHLMGWDLENARVGPEPRAAATRASRAVRWLRIYDQRPSRVTRRDVSRPVTWLAGKRVLILGCGALGAPIAEYCVRAGVAALYLVDDGWVNPGILVRQPYRYRDIGWPKSFATAQRLKHLTPGLTVHHRIENATATPHNTLAAVDLIIDATANRAVAEWLETLWRSDNRPTAPAVAVMVGHETQLAVATIALPGSSGAGVDVLRRLAIAAFDGDDLADLVDDLYPAVPRTEAFQPEPGCSDPTFVGSASDLAALSARLFNAAIAFVATSTTRGADDAAYAATRAAAVLRHATGFSAELPTRNLQWGNDFVLTDAAGVYEVRVDPSALASMRQEAIRADQLDAGAREAGGVLLGQIDPACRVVWVSTALGETPGSDASAGHVKLDIDKIRASILEESSRTRGMKAFIGAWHNHPRGVVAPSQVDLATMHEIVNGEHSSMPAALLVILGGNAKRWDNWLAGIARPDIHAQMFFSERVDPHGREVRNGDHG
jgi:hypothetical protein